MMTLQSLRVLSVIISVEFPQCLCFFLRCVLKHVVWFKCRGHCSVDAKFLMCTGDGSSQNSASHCVN